MIVDEHRLKSLERQIVFLKRVVTVYSFLFGAIAVILAKVLLSSL